MTELILKGRAELARMGLGQGHASPQGQVIPDLPFGRLLAVAVVAVLIASPGVVGEAARGALADAYLAVAVFVAGTLALLAWAERSANVDLAKTLEGAGWARVPIAALLGAFPGCGGAVVVATQFARGKASFGSLVATLTATMGDAAILLLAQAPMTALSVIGISFVAGILLGWAVDAAHGERLGNALRHSAGGMGQSVPAKPSALVGGSFGVRPWMVLMVPGTVLGVLLAFQADPDAWIAALTGVAFPMTEVLGIAGAMLGLALWATRPVSRCVGGACGMPEGQGTRPLATRIMDDTNFVSAWVVFGFLAYEVTMALGSFDLAGFFQVYAPVMPLMAVLIGMVPGCGPPLVITSLYLSGLVPPSVLMANALANDGDALFPALALTPRAALLASVYSAIPALIVGYAVFFLIG